MKIIYKKGNLLNCEEKVIIHGVSLAGVMGAGIALAIKKKYPEAYDEYEKAYRLGFLRLGTIVWADIPTKNKVVGNAVTQQYYGREKKVYVSYDAIKKIMHHLNRFYVDTFPVIAMPKIGAGLAGGDWGVIEKIIEEELTDVQPVVYYL